jgi:hypothetical protein
MTAMRVAEKNYDFSNGMEQIAARVALGLVLKTFVYVSTAQFMRCILKEYCQLLLDDMLNNDSPDNSSRLKTDPMNLQPRRQNSRISFAENTPLFDPQ